MSAARARLRDVAQHARVSVTTASLVLNGKDASIGVATRQRVRQAADELRYRPNLLARGLRGTRRRTIAFISVDVLTTPYASAMALGAQSVADEHGYGLLLANVDDVAERRAETIESLIDRQVDGAIFATMYHRQVEVPEQLAATTTVLLDASPLDATAAVSSVVPDEQGGMTLALDHLLAVGHQRIAFVGHHLGLPAPNERRAAYDEFVALHDLQVEDGYVVEGDGTTQSGVVAAGDMLGKFVERDTFTPNAPTAIVCFNDRTAAGVYIAAARRNIRIPDDLSVVGFDNQELIVNAIHPNLTSVELPHEAMGRWATDQLLRLLEGEASHDHVRMSCELVERNSVAPPRAKSTT